MTTPSAADLTAALDRLGHSVRWLQRYTDFSQAEYDQDIAALDLVRAALDAKDAEIARLRAMVEGTATHAQPTQIAP